MTAAAPTPGWRARLVLVRIDGVTSRASEPFAKAEADLRVDRIAAMLMAGVFPP
jgi:hypothetical protein